jgi:benzoyl-CoA reductase/2-hydroxyglutaryl-CoA dehydratase subunit BcrC/BadD/HgdB
MIEEILSGTPSQGVVVTTTCDQMRYAAAVLEREARLPVFLMNVPSTCENEAAALLYRDEIVRLGRFLESLGGHRPSDQRLAEVMLEYDRARAAVLADREHLSARQSAEAILAIRRGELGRVRAGTHLMSSESPAIRLALVGGPLAEEDFDLLDLVEASGGRIVLDASEGGERTLPAAPDAQRLWRSPLDELARIYFGAIPDCFRRPNDALYRWLAEMLSARQVRGILFRRYVWCDLWHAELARLKERSPVPVLELDVGDGRGAGGQGPAAGGRVEAFLEMLG